MIIFETQEEFERVLMEVVTRRLEVNIVMEKQYDSYENRTSADVESVYLYDKES